MSPLAPPVPGLRLRRATPGDAGALLRWRNDPETRRQSLNGEPVAPDTHMAWLARCLDDPRCRLLMAETGGVAGEPVAGEAVAGEPVAGEPVAGEPVAVGSVRCDGGDDGRWRLSWQIAPEHRGQGYAPAMLRAAVETLKDEPGLAGAELWAEIKAANIASRRAAAAAGFVCVDEGAAVTRWRLTLSGSRGIR